MEAFKVMDKDKDGFITAADLKEVLAYQYIGIQYFQLETSSMIGTLTGAGGSEVKKKHCHFHL